jgi:hypothetical protein
MRKKRLLNGLYAAAALLLGPGIGSADVVSDWNALMVTTVSDQSPFAQARFAAITQLAVFEAVNAITGDFKPYLGTINAPSSASAEAAAIAAAHTVLKNYFPANAASLDAARASSLAAIADGPAKNAGIAAGDAAAAAMIVARSSDGSGTPKFHMPSSSGPGEWQTTPSCAAGGGVFLHWPEVTPFGIKSASQFRLDPPPSLTSTSYTRDYNEERAVGGVNSTERPQDRADLARVYANITPVLIFNPVVRSAAQGKSLTETARALALLNMAISDAAVATFDTKYHYRLWRPETAIRAGDTDGNPKTDPDAAFAPFIATPCFPSYPSAHATLSNAAREMIERIFGGGPQSITVSTPAVPGVTLQYDKLKQITADIDDARVYGGIHFRFDQDAGAEQGRRVGEYVYKNNLSRAKACSCDEDD